MDDNKSSVCCVLDFMTLKLELFRFKQIQLQFEMSVLFYLCWLIYILYCNVFDGVSDVQTLPVPYAVCALVSETE